jgi:glycosyltransferase involved in cell wall biosynthesis
MITELADFYRRHDIEPLVFTKMWPANLSERDEYRGTKIYRVISAKKDDEFKSIIDWVKKNNNEIKSDIIHVIGIRRPLPLIALLLARFWNVPIICTIAGGDIPDEHDPQTTKVWADGTTLIPDVLRQSNRVNCVSEALVKSARGLMPDVKNIDTLYAGMDFSVIRNSTPEKIKDKFILSLRRLDPSKGVDILIKSFALVKDTFPDVYLVIAGEGSEEEKLRKIVKQHSLNSRVIFLGTVTLPRAISLLKGATLTVVPSLSEGGGLVNIEAQAASCPVIASRVGGIPEYVIDGISGILFESGNVDELAQKIKLVITEPHLRRKIINGGLEHSQRFDWDILGPQYIALYEKAIAQHRTDIMFEPWSDLTEILWNKLNR